MDKASLGLAIRRLREKANISQEGFAELCSLHRTYIGSVERGERNVSIDNLIKIAQALDCKLSQLIALAEDMSK